MVAGRRVWAVVAAIGLVAVLGLYGMGGLSGNHAEARACRDAPAQAQKLDPLATGEVAALQPAREPQDLRGLRFTGLNEEPLSVADFAGKVTLVNLWATWCVPCRQEMPALDRLQAAAGGPDFAIVAVSVDAGGPEKPRRFLQEVGVAALPYYADPSSDIFNELKKHSLARGLPVTLLLDRAGCLLGHMNGPAEWDSPDGRSLIDAATRL